MTWRPRPDADGATRTTATSSCRATGWRRTPRRRARRAASGRSRRCGSRAASRGWAWTPTHRTIPNEAGWIGPAVHLDKGCYRGQETVARVHTLGRPPRRLTLLHLDGSENRLPAAGLRACCSARRSSASSAPRRATTSSARSRWRWSSATSPLDATLDGRRHARRARRWWSTPRSGCTSGRCAELVARLGAGFGTKPRGSAPKRCGSCPLGDATAVGAVGPPGDVESAQLCPLWLNRPVRTISVLCRIRCGELVTETWVVRTGDEAGLRVVNP